MGGQTFLRLNDPIKKGVQVCDNSSLLIEGICPHLDFTKEQKMRSKVNVVYKQGNSKFRRTQKSYTENMHITVLEAGSKTNKTKKRCEADLHLKRVEI